MQSGIYTDSLSQIKFLAKRSSSSITCDVLRAITLGCIVRKRVELVCGLADSDRAVPSGPRVLVCRPDSRLGLLRRHRLWVSRSYHGVTVSSRVDKARQLECEKFVPHHEVFSSASSNCHKTARSRAALSTIKCLRNIETERS